MAVAVEILIFLVIQICQGLPSVSVQNAGSQYASASYLPVGLKNWNQNLGAPSEAQELLNGGIYPKYPVGFEPGLPGANYLGHQQHFPIPVQNHVVSVPVGLGNNLNNVANPNQILKQIPQGNQNLGAPSEAQELLNGGIYPKYPVGFEPGLPGANYLGHQQHFPIPVQNHVVSVPVGLGNNLNNVANPNQILKQIPQGGQLYNGISPQRQYPEQILQNPQNLVAPLIDTAPIQRIIPSNGNNVNANNARDINVNQILQKYQNGNIPSALNYNTASASAHSTNNVLYFQPEYLRSLQNLNNQASFNASLGGNNILRYINGRLEPLDGNQLNLLQNKRLNSLLKEYLREPTRNIIRPESIFANNPLRAGPLINLGPGPVVINPQEPALVSPINTILSNNTSTLPNVNGPSAVALAQVVNSLNGTTATAQASALSGGNNPLVGTINDPRTNVTSPTNNTLSNNTVVNINDPRINITNPINNTLINNTSTLTNVNAAAQIINSLNGTTATAQASATSCANNAKIANINDPIINTTNLNNNTLSNIISALPYVNGPSAVALAEVINSLNGTTATAQAAAMSEGSNVTIANINDPRINITNPANNILSNNTSTLPYINGLSALATAQAVNSQNETAVITQASANSGGNNTVVVSSNQNLTTLNGTTSLNVSNQTNPNNTSIGNVNVPTINITSPINNTLNNNTTVVPKNNVASASAIAQIINSPNGTTVISQASANSGGNNTVVVRNNQNISLNNRTTPLIINNQTSQNNTQVNVPIINITNPINNTLFNNTLALPNTNGQNPVATAQGTTTNGGHNTVNVVVTTTINGIQTNANTTTIQLQGNINDPTSITNEINNILSNMIQAMNNINGQSTAAPAQTVNEQNENVPNNTSVVVSSSSNTSTVTLVNNNRTNSSEQDGNNGSVNNQVSITQDTPIVDENNELETTSVLIVDNDGSEEADPTKGIASE